MKNTKKILKKTYINREISWLSFNERVLQEAEDPINPLIERIKFLGIFSSNMDEFFRVRVATMKRMVIAGRKFQALLGDDPNKIIKEIQRIVIKLQDKFDIIYNKILRELEEKNIILINEKQLTPEQCTFVKTYFEEEVHPQLFPVMLDNCNQFPTLKDHAIYLAVRLHKDKKPDDPQHALIEIPSTIISRFLVLPKTNRNTYIILLDDVIRLGLESIFSPFNFTEFEAYTIKLTRDAELDFDDDITISFYEKISKSLKQRKKGTPVRFVYDETMPKDFLKMLMKHMHITSRDALIPGGRYHNFKDFMDFPPVGTPDLLYEPFPPLSHKDIDPKKSLLARIRKKDILLHYPYQSFHYIIDFLREASIDPNVTSIKITLYRVAKDSSVVNALIQAARNGKSVTVLMELRARFDEEANIYWTNRLNEEGVRIIHGVPNLKVHCKVCLVARREKDGLVHYVNIGTGNYNEKTAKVYSDHSIFTTDTRITNDVRKLFDFFDNNYKIKKYNHLLVSPFYLRKKLSNFIRNEITYARQGKDAYILLKMNSLVDRKMIERLYKASSEGVKIDLLVRGICSLIPGVKGLSENIRVISILDRFLEHSRIFVFHNGGEELYYISSNDWMTRNLDSRIEVACPVYDKDIQAEIKDYLMIELRDNVKAREINAAQDNRYRRDNGDTPCRVQYDFYNYLKEKVEHLKI
jgi:polyphosphate kinase